MARIISQKGKRISLDVRTLEKGTIYKDETTPTAPWRLVGDITEEGRRVIFDYRTKKAAKEAWDMAERMRINREAGIN